MNCHDCQTWLQRRLDGEPPSTVAPTAEVEQHWADCAICREQHLATIQLLEGLKQLPRPKAPAGFAAAIAAEVLRDRRRRIEKLRRGVYVTAALAASIVLLMLAGYLWMPRTTPVGPEPKQPMAKIPDEKKIEPAPPRQQEPRHALTALTDRWADTTRDHAKVVLVATNLDVVDKLPMTDLPALEPMREAGQEVSDGVRAVTRNARRAFNFIAGVADAGNWSTGELN